MSDCPSNLKISVTDELMRLCFSGNWGTSRVPLVNDKTFRYDLENWHVKKANNTIKNFKASATLLLDPLPLAAFGGK